MSRRNVTFWEALAKFPPYYVRLLAKEKFRALSDAEVAISAGLPIDRVREIKFYTDWNRVTMGEFFAYTSACNFDPTSAIDRHRVYQYEHVCKKRKTKPFRYLERSPKWETELLPLLKIVSRPRSSAA